MVTSSKQSFKYRDSMALDIQAANQEYEEALIKNCSPA